MAIARCSPGPCVPVGYLQSPGEMFQGGCGRHHSANDMSGLHVAVVDMIRADRVHR